MAYCCVSLGLVGWSAKAKFEVHLLSTSKDSKNLIPDQIFHSNGIEHFSRDYPYFTDHPVKCCKWNKIREYEDQDERIRIKLIIEVDHVFGGRYIKKIEIGDGHIWYDENRELTGRKTGVLVYEGKILNQQCVVKRVPKSIKSHAKSEFQDNKEIQALLTMRHPNVIHCFGYLDIGSSYYIFLDHCVCTISDYIQKKEFKEKFHDMDKLEVIRQLASGLEYIHGKKTNNKNTIILHRDIKPHNILLRRDNIGEPLAIISDLGLAKLTDDGENSRSVSDRHGSQGYKAPELKKGCIEMEVTHLTILMGIPMMMIDKTTLNINGLIFSLENSYKPT
uniref:Endoribonuclease n=1 Tax=Acrobeloides nanus TaxID=290746 RepID=A0A914BZH9_9BILA